MKHLYYQHFLALLATTLCFSSAVADELPTAIIATSSNQICFGKKVTFNASQSIDATSYE